MDTRSTSDVFAQLVEELLALAQKTGLPEKTCHIAIGFMRCYKEALDSSHLPFAPHAPTFRLFFQLLASELTSPHTFGPYHRKLRAPVDYYQFSLDFIRPLIELERSHLFGMQYVDEIAEKIARGENAILFANHQSETDPQVIAILLEQAGYPQLAEQIIYVAGTRVITDPLAIPFSLGCNLLCIHSKRYIDHPPEQKASKQLHNKNTMELMSRLLQEGRQVIYVAPSGGRDRKNETGEVVPTPFDPNSIEMFYLMAQKSQKTTHFYPLALNTHDLLPPPELVQIELGETRIARRAPVHLAFGPECDMQHYPGKDSPVKEERRKGRAESIWKTVCHLYAQCKR